MKKEKQDFTAKKRPSSRKKQFVDIFSHRFLELFKISLLQAVFAMPLLVSVVLFYVFVKNAGDRNALFTVFLIQSASLLVTIPVNFIGMTGSLYCAKKLIYAEGEFASSSFFIGLREEWKRGMLFGFIEGLSAALTVIGLFAFIVIWSELSPSVTGLGIAVVIIQFVVVTMIMYHCMGQIVVYQNTLRNIFKNSFIIAMIRFPINLLFLVIHPGIFIALVCIMEITMYVGVVLFIFLSMVSYLIWMLNLIAAFDKYINKENYPDFYKKGLYIENQN